jgi:hypothetical protein
MPEFPIMDLSGEQHETWGPPLTAQGAEIRLIALGYDAQLAAMAVRIAGEVAGELRRPGWFNLKEHQVTTQNSTYYIQPLRPGTPRLLVPPRGEFGEMAFAPGDNPWYRPGRHTGKPSCKVRPLHDPCHTGSDGDTRGSEEILRDMLDAWRDALASRSSRRGPDYLDAAARGESFPEMRAAAMAKARALYGEDAELAVEDIRDVRTYGTGFIATFVIHCTDFPREAP